MAIARLSLLLITAIAQHYAFTSPNVRPPSEERRDQGHSERMTLLFVFTFKSLVWSLTLLEGSVLFALSGYCPPALSRPFLHTLPASLTSYPSATALTPLTVITPTFLAGTILTVAGTLIRVYCFRTLGPRFTFELSIRPSHTLVTDGVYGIVRHPSYTAALAATMGCLLCVFDRQGFAVSVCTGLVQTGGNENVRGDVMVTGVLTCMWVAMVSMAYLGIHKRMDNEDAMLEKNFGEQWRAWTRRVPYRLVPGVY